MEIFKKYPTSLQWLFLLIVFFALCFAIDIPEGYKFIRAQAEHIKDPNQVANYYKASDLYLITSREEGGPKSILESMACGVPLISTKVGMAEDIIIDGQNGYLVDIEDVDTIYNRACTLIENQELSLKFINSGLKTVKEYDWVNIAN